MGQGHSEEKLEFPSGSSQEKQRMTSSYADDEEKNVINSTSKEIGGSLTNQFYDLRTPALSEEQALVEKELVAAYMDACYRCLASDDVSKSFAPNEQFQLTIESLDYVNYQENQNDIKECVSSFYFDLLKVVKTVVDYEDTVRLNQEKDSNEPRGPNPGGSRSSTGAFNSTYTSSMSDYSSHNAYDCSVLNDALLSYFLTSGHVVVRDGFFFMFWHNIVGEKIGYLEYRASRWVMETRVQNLHVPLHYHIRYKGRGVTVIALAPISESLTIVSEQNVEVAAMAQQIASAFSLFPYTKVEGEGEDRRSASESAFEGGSNFFFLPKNVQAHFGRDGRYYFIHNRKWFPQWLLGRHRKKQAQHHQSLTCVNPLLLASRGVSLSCRSFMPDAFISENKIALEFMKNEIDTGLHQLIAKVREKHLEKIERKNNRKNHNAKTQLFSYRSFSSDLANGGSHLNANNNTNSGGRTNALTGATLTGFTTSDETDNSQNPLARGFSQVEVSPFVSSGKAGTYSMLEDSDYSFSDADEDVGTEFFNEEESVNIYATGSVIKLFNKRGYPKSLLGILYLTLMQYAAPPMHMVREVKREIFYRGIKDYIICRTYDARFLDSRNEANFGGGSSDAFVRKDLPDQELETWRNLEDMDDSDVNSQFSDEYIMQSGIMHRETVLNVLGSAGSKVKHVASLFLGHPTIANEERANGGSGVVKGKGHDDTYVEETTKSSNPFSKGIHTQHRMSHLSNEDESEYDFGGDKGGSSNVDVSHLNGRTFQSIIEGALVGFMQYSGKEIPEKMYFRNGATDDDNVWEELFAIHAAYCEIILPFVLRKFNLPPNMVPSLYEPLLEEDKMYVYNSICAAFGVSIVNGVIAKNVPIVKDFSPRIVEPKKVSSLIPTAPNHFMIPLWIKVQTKQLLHSLYFRKEASHREWDLCGACLITFLALQQRFCVDMIREYSTLYPGHPNATTLGNSPATFPTSRRHSSRPSNQPVSDYNYHPSEGFGSYVLPPLKKLGRVLLRQVSNMSSNPAILWHALATDCFISDEEDMNNLFRHNRAAMVNVSSFGFTSGLDLAIDLRRDQIRNFADRCMIIQLLRRQARIVYRLESIPVPRVSNIHEECWRVFRPLPPMNENFQVDLNDTVSEDNQLPLAVSAMEEVVFHADNVLQHLGNSFSVQYHRFTFEFMYSLHFCPVQLMSLKSQSAVDEEVVLKHMLSMLKKFCSQDILAGKDLMERALQLYNKSLNMRSPNASDPITSSSVPADPELELLFGSAAELFSSCTGYHSPETLRAFTNLALYYYGVGNYEQWKETIWRLRQSWVDDGQEDIRILLSSTQPTGVRVWGSNFGFRSSSNAEKMSSTQLIVHYPGF